MTAMGFLLVVTLLALLTSSMLKAEEEPLKDLHLVGLIPMSGSSDNQLGPIILTSTKMAINYINNRPDLLAGYRLKLDWADTKCNLGLGVHRMYELLNTPPDKAAILGAACSAVSAATCYLRVISILEPGPGKTRITLGFASGDTGRNNTSWPTGVHLCLCLILIAQFMLLKVAAVSLSPSLSDKKRYPRFFRVASSALDNNPARIALLHHFSWSRVATITESQDLYTMLTNNAHVRFRENNITLITAEVFTDSPREQVLNLKKHDARIIFLSSTLPKGVKVACEAYKIGLYGPGMIWIIPGFWGNRWWELDYESCTRKELTRFVEGIFMTTSMDSFADWSQITDYGSSINDFAKAYNKYSNGTIPFVERISSRTFDAVYATALAMNMTMNQLKESGSNKTLGDLKYREVEMHDMIFNNMWEVDFNGYTGAVLFNENGDVPGKITISRVQGGSSVRIAGFDLLEGDLKWNPDNPIIWTGGSPPADSTVQMFEPILVTPPVYVAMTTVAAVGIITGLGFIGFNLKYRSLRIIKMSSPLVNNIIVVGCILVYSTVFWKELDTANTLLMCQVRTFLLMIGFSTSFGALFAKTWRVHKIFTSKLARVVMKDSKMVLITLAIVSFDVLLFVLFAILDPQRVEIIITASVSEDNGNILRHSQVHMCTSDKGNYFDGIVYATKGLLLLFGSFLAWETRKVTIPALNDSQYIGMCIYNVVVLSLMGVVLSYVLVLHVTMHYMLTSAILMLGTTMTLVIIFIPKTLKVLAGEGDKETKTQFGTANSVVPSTQETTLTPDVQERLQKALEENDCLKKDLEEKDKRIANLGGQNESNAEEV